MKQMIGPGSLNTFHVVLSVCIERGYPGDPLSSAREVSSFTVHQDPDEARARLFAELDCDIQPASALSLRRSFLSEARVPASMMAFGCPRRWLSDRLRILPGLSSAFSQSHLLSTQGEALEAILIKDILDRFQTLSELLEDPGDPSLGATAVAALEAAGSVARAQVHGAITNEVARRASGVAKAIGAAAWDGADAEHLAPALEALLPLFGEPIGALDRSRALENELLLRHIPDAVPDLEAA